MWLFLSPHVFGGVLLINVLRTSSITLSCCPWLSWRVLCSCIDCRRNSCRQKSGTSLLLQVQHKTGFLLSVRMFGNECVWRKNFLVGSTCELELVAHQELSRTRLKLVFAYHRHMFESTEKDRLGLSWIRFRYIVCLVGIWYMDVVYQKRVWTYFTCAVWPQVAVITNFLTALGDCYDFGFLWRKPNYF